MNPVVGKECRKGTSSCPGTWFFAGSCLNGPLAGIRASVLHNPHGQRSHKDAVLSGVGCNLVGLKTMVTCSRAMRGQRAQEKRERIFCQVTCMLQTVQTAIDSMLHPCYTSDLHERVLGRFGGTTIPALNPKQIFNDCRLGKRLFSRFNLVSLSQ